MRIPRTLLACLGSLTGLAAVAVLLVAPGPATGAAPAPRPDAAARAGYDKPIAGFKVGDPGVVFDGAQWVDLATGTWSKSGEISTAPTVKGPWTLSGTPLLTKRPAWASDRDHSVWAPSIVASTKGNWVIYYAAIVAGQSSARCIGTAHAKVATGPFKPSGKPIVCYTGSHTDPAAVVKSEGRNFSLIDATPSVIDGAYYLTFKTQYRLPGKWHSTTRIVQLDPANPGGTTVGHVSTMTSWVSPSIEENPVLVKRGSVYTLFTSRGWYGTCTGRYPYHTVYRQTTDLGHWPANPVTLRFPQHSHTCGTGDAAVAPNGDKWTIFFSGHYPREADSFKLYTGNLVWDGAGRPSVKGVYHR